MVIRNFPVFWRTILTLKLLAEGRWERDSWLVDGGKGSTNSVAFPALNYISSPVEICSSCIRTSVGPPALVECPGAPG